MSGDDDSKAISLSRQDSDFKHLALAVLQSGSGLRFRAGGRSMRPCIRHGDVLTIPPNKDALYPGKIVACLSPDGKSIFIHRIIAIIQDQYILQGDNRAAPDGVFTIADILGCVCKVERQGRPVRFGLGWQGRIIAWLVRWDIVLLVKKIRYKTSQRFLIPLKRFRDCL